MPTTSSKVGNKMGKNARFRRGDVFIVPLVGSDGAAGLGQVVELAEDALGSVLCAYYGSIFLPGDAPDASALTSDDVISVQFTTADQLRAGKWPIVGVGLAPDPNAFMDFQGLKERGYIGADIIGSAIVVKFLSAFHGRVPWDCYYRPDYFDDLLLTKGRRPRLAFFEGSAPPNT